MARTAVGSPDNWGKWLAVAGALATVGLLPPDWRKPLAIASAAVLLLKLW